jgi:hypothetical protein
MADRTDPTESSWRSWFRFLFGCLLLALSVTTLAPMAITAPLGSPLWLGGLIGVGTCLALALPWIVRFLRSS